MVTGESPSKETLSASMVKLLLTVLLLIPMMRYVIPLQCFLKDPVPVPHEWYQAGDFLIGGILSQLFSTHPVLPFEEHPSKRLFEVPQMVTKLYQHVLALASAIQEVNQNPKILPNLTLGFHIYDSYYDARMTYRTTLDLLFRAHRFVPSYKCDLQKNLMGVIGGLTGDISDRMADLLGLYKIPQLTYGSFAPEKRETKGFPSFYRMLLNESHQYRALIHLLLHFGWTWVGLFVLDDDTGDHFIKVVEPLLTQKGICLSFTGRIPQQNNFETVCDLNNLMGEIYPPFVKSKANTFILYGEILTINMINFYLFLEEPEYIEKESFRKVWIMMGQIDLAVTSTARNLGFQLFQGAVTFQMHFNEFPEFQEYLRIRKHYWTQENGFLKDFWEQAFDCFFPNPTEPVKNNETCTGEEKLESLPQTVFEMHMTDHSYGICNAVYAVAHVLHATSSSNLKKNPPWFKKHDLQNLQPWQLHHLLQGISFNNSAGGHVSLDDNGEIEAGYDVINTVVFPNNSFLRVKVGRVDSKGKDFIIHEHLIEWQRHFNQVHPVSLCNDPCPPGSQKQKKEGEKFCCYSCGQCPKGKTSVEKDMDSCIECPEEKYPSKNRDHCIPRMLHYLSYEEPLGISLASAAGFLSLITVLVLSIFIQYKDTPIVKANNREITYLLLVSLLLCFLCSFLFLGQPTKMTCLLQQSAFSIIFSVAVSCLLAKTITVVVAFVATKPGSSMRKWVGRRLAISIVFSCSLVQAGLCSLWLGISPPSPSFDTQSVRGEIIAGCSEGSAIMFYIALCYMGLLSFISLSVAFLARKLPDSFNESKFITFSMLMFCSVWLSFIPTYVSTKGKYMVAVEVFSILVSSGGILACIFSPKCYIIALRPELNNREMVARAHHKLAAA